MTQQQKKIGITTLCAVAGLIITLASVLLAVGAQNQKLEQVTAKQEAMDITVKTHDRSITTLETKVDYIVKTLDEIKSEVKKQ
jgi:hypothetical protein